jgi:uncharacterized protein YkwD
MCSVISHAAGVSRRQAHVPRLGMLAVGCIMAGGVPANGPPGSSTDAPAVITAAPTCNLADFRAELLRRVNELRAAGAECGNQGSFAPTLPLVWNEGLAKAAEGHSRDMGTQDYLEHVGRDGSTPAMRVDAQGYAWSMVAENIAGGQPGIAEVMESWRRSPGHCANLMKPGLKEIGVACVRASGTRYRLYWTMVLGTPLQM